MKSLEIEKIETINGGSKFGAFCAGFAAGELAAAGAIGIGLIAAPPLGAAAYVILGAINLACAYEGLSLSLIHI